MTNWSGRDALIADFLPRFHDRQVLLDSLAEYIRSARVLDDQRARHWLEQDVLRDQELHAIEDPDHLGPTPSRYAPNGCYHCYGHGFVRHDVEIDHPDFGKALPCPACHNRRTDPALHCDTCVAFASEQFAPASPNQCWQCGRFEDESAAESCGNPRWHLPNSRSPAPRPVEGWRSVATSLPGRHD